MTCFCNCVIAFCILQGGRKTYGCTFPFGVLFLDMLSRLDVHDIGVRAKSLSSFVCQSNIILMKTARANDWYVQKYLKVTWTGLDVVLPVVIPMRVIIVCWLIIGCSPISVGMHYSTLCSVHYMHLAFFELQNKEQQLNGKADGEWYSFHVAPCLLHSCAVHRMLNAKWKLALF